MAGAQGFVPSESCLWPRVAESQQHRELVGLSTNSRRKLPLSVASSGWKAKTVGSRGLRLHRSGFEDRRFSLVPRPRQRRFQPGNFRGSSKSLLRSLRYLRCEPSSGRFRATYGNSRRRSAKSPVETKGLQAKGPVLSRLFVLVARLFTIIDLA